MRDVTPLEWVEALESGEYKQMRGRLAGSDSNSHCCLGVLGKLLGMEVDSSGVDNGVTFLRDPKTQKIVTTDLPLGIRPKWMTMSRMQKFIAMNDMRKKSFIEIAAEAREIYNLGEK